LIKLAITDDNPIIREELYHLLLHLCEDYSLDYSIDLYENGDQLLHSKTQYDLIILDIEMDKINGIEVKNNLLSLYQPYIIFLSGYRDKILEAFGQNVLAYIDKNDSDYQSKIKNIFKSYIDKSNIFIDDIPVSLNTVYCLEASSSYTIIHSHTKDYLVRKTLKELENKLDYRFYRIHRSYIINFNYFKSLNHKSITLTNNLSFKITRGKSKAIKEAYFLFVKGK